MSDESQQGREADKRIGNKFWKQRSKHGREKIFKDPHTMLMAAYEYFEYNAKNPWYKKEAVKSGEWVGTIIDIPVETPLTIYGLTQFWGVNSKYLEQFERNLPPDENDFSPVICHIKDIIKRHQLEGATIGVFNGNIISRLLGLSDKHEVTAKTRLLGKDLAEETYE